MASRPRTLRAASATRRHAQPSSGGARQLAEPPVSHGIDLGNQYGTRQTQVPAEGGGALAQDAGIDDVASDQLVQADCLETPIGLGDCSGLDQAQCGNRGCLPKGYQLILRQVVLGGEHHGHAVSLRPGLDRLHTNPELPEFGGQSSPAQSSRGVSVE